ncbi:MAG: hypothetical protein P8X47_10155 [Ignavibacteriaceae bacterium]
MKDHSTAVLLISIFGLILAFGCTTRFELSDKNTNTERRNYERIVYGNKGNPILKIVCKYVGKKPVKGFKTDIRWKIIDTDFYNLSFINLTDKKIEFISSEFYQSLPKEIALERNLLAKRSVILIEHKDYRKEHDPKFDPLEYREERTLINWPVHTNNRYPYSLTNIIFQIKHMQQTYRFNIFIVYEK